jgi:hypothetical protein
MTVLAYCITATEPRVRIPSVGLEGRSIRFLTESGLHCFISDYGNEASGKSVRESALLFSRVLEEIFAQVAIIPFCFPTLVASESEISDFVRDHAAEYRKALFRLRDSVQMDVLLSFKDSEGKLRASEKSGTDYLRRRLNRHQRLQTIAEEFRQSGQPLIQDWRQYEIPSGVRGHALVARGLTASFLEKMKNVAVPADLKARITGPWPATAFLKEN